MQIAEKSCRILLIEARLRCKQKGQDQSKASICGYCAKEAIFIFLVRFIPKDPDSIPEEYYYYNEADAFYHYNIMTQEEIDELYDRVELIKYVDAEIEQVHIRESDA